VRSVLYVPGSRARALEKARGLRVDVLILDLEDAVAPSAKDEAREAVRAAVTAGGFRASTLVTVRVNALDTPWGAADVAMAASLPGVAAVVLPKVGGAPAVREAVAAMEAAMAALAMTGGQGGQGGQGALALPNEAMELWPMLETPLGVLRAEEIAAAHGRVGALVMGTSDLAKELHAADTRCRHALLPALGRCVLAARAHGVRALDGVHLDLADDEAFEAACVQGREMGFDGKTLIHPRTVAAANRAFAPTAAEVARAHAVIGAHGEAVARGEGVVVLEGRLVENLHVEDARRVLALHGRCGDADGGDAV
jgi:citrate lyase subunit beta/citryl-CoA lyase